MDGIQKWLKKIGTQANQQWHLTQSYWANHIYPFLTKHKQIYWDNQAVPVFQKLKMRSKKIRPVLEEKTDLLLEKIKPALARAKNNAAPILQKIMPIKNYFTQLITKIKLQWFFFKDKPAVKEKIEKAELHYEKCYTQIKIYWHRLLTQSTLAKELNEASQYHVRTPTILSTLFVNLLSLAFPLALMQVYDRIIPNQSYSTLVILSLGVAIALLIEIVLRIARAYIDLWADTRYEYGLSKKAFHNLINVPLYLYEKADIGTRLKQFSILNQLKGFYNNQLLVAICDIPFLIIFFIIIAYIGGILFLIPLIITALMGYASFFFIQHWKHFLEEKISHESHENDFIVNVLTNIHTVKALGMEDLMMRRYERLQKKGAVINYLTGVQSGDLSTLKVFSNQLVTVLMATFGSLLVIQGSLAVGGLAACILLVGRVVQPLNRVLSAFNQWSMLNIIRKQLDSVLQLPTQQKETTPLQDPFQGNIAFKNLSFYFNDQQSQPILNNITLDIPAKTVVSITGQDAVAKSTLLNILATITKPVSGEYLLDGQNVDQYPSYEIREKITFLSKSGKLFHGTMMENLSAFDEDLIPAARRLVEALDLNKIIAKLPNGFDTMVGDKAVEALPGGVINLIFIIRALVNKPKIILFDEANVNLDTQSNKKMIELLVTLKETATLIILPNSEFTMALSNVIYCLKDGNLIRENHAA